MSTNIKELISAGAAAGDVSTKVAEQVIVAVFAEIVAKLKADEEVTVRDFGRFFTRVRPARTARNPRTREPIDVPAKTVIKFSPRGSLK